GNVCSEDILFMIAEAGYDTTADVWALCAAATELSESLASELPGRLHRAGPPPWFDAARMTEPS
ncbi:MAG: hydroxymethylglutaryl-CoA lyase, partial [Candidatus Dormibacteria bacterium]